MDTIARQPRPLGPNGQRPLLKLRRRTRTQALVLRRWAALHDISLRYLAARIGLAEQTVSDWSSQRIKRRLDTASRGRPRHTLSLEEENHVRELLGECRGRLGFQMAEVAVPRKLFQLILERIRRLRLPTAVSG